jgi:hypothetical protein
MWGFRAKSISASYFFAGTWTTRFITAADFNFGCGSDTGKKRTDRL